MNASSSFVCKSCRLSGARPAAVRAFTTTPSHNAIPPESPTYLDIPNSYQPDRRSIRRAKGVLPVPRELFPPRQPDKPSAAYLDRLIKPQTASSSAASEKDPFAMSEQQAYKAKMTTLRRSHLRSGLLELYNRKTHMNDSISRRSAKVQTERKRLIDQPARPDDTLTAPTTPSSLMPTGTPPPPASAAIQARKAANANRHASAAKEARLASLHTLYMNARTFITTEAQLDAEIDHVFDHPEEEWGTMSGNGSNIWNRGAPATVAQMLLQNESGLGSSGMGGKGMNLEAFYLRGQRGAGEKFARDQERMKRVAEELTGGKI